MAAQRERGKSMGKRIMGTAPHLLRGHESRERVMDHAVEVAATEGLEALTIGRIAAAAGLSKAGLLGHFHSKEELQLATLEAGREVFDDAVMRPVRDAPAGIVRVARLLDRWIDYTAKCPGGCFFTSVAAEFDGRSGPVKRAIAKRMRAWLHELEALLRSARDLGHLDAKTNPPALTLRLHGYQLALNLRRQLLGDTRALALARAAMRSALAENATRIGRNLLDRDASG